MGGNMSNKPKTIFDEVVRSPIRLINEKRSINHFDIARMFSLNPAAVASFLDHYKTLDGQKDTVFVDPPTELPQMRWATDVAFYALYSELNLNEALGQAVLHALGHFESKEAA